MARSFYSSSKFGRFSNVSSAAGGGVGQAWIIPIDVQVEWFCETVEELESYWLQ